MKKYKEIKGNDKINYNWESIKRDTSFRIEYNDKIIEIIKAKLVKSVKKLKKEKIKEYNLKNSKAKKGSKLPGNVNYKEFNKSLNTNLKEIKDDYEGFINYVKKQPLYNLLNNFKKKFINELKYLI